MTFLSKMPVKTIFQNEVKVRKSLDSKSYKDLLDDEFKNNLKEYSRFTVCKINFHRVNFAIYESFFRTFCYNPSADQPYLLRADKQSLAKGLAYWYGRENEFLSGLLYDYFSKGFQNHLITFVEFVEFS